MNVQFIWIRHHISLILHNINGSDGDFHFFFLVLKYRILFMFILESVARVTHLIARGSNHMKTRLLPFWWCLIFGYLFIEIYFTELICMNSKAWRMHLMYKFIRMNMRYVIRRLSKNFHSEYFLIPQVFPNWKKILAIRIGNSQLPNPFYSTGAQWKPHIKQNQRKKSIREIRKKGIKYSIDSRNWFASEGLKTTKKKMKRR